MPRQSKRGQNNKKKVVVVARRKKPTAPQQEVSAIGQALRALGGLGGGFAGGMLGQSSAGSALGTSLGAAVSKWLGSGDYTVRQNSIVSSTLRGSASVPMMHNTGQTVTIRHKEYLCAITGSVAFKVQRFFILQPGDANTFPWLSGIAHRFQQYRIKGMVLHYVPTSGYAVSGTNPALGSVMMQTSYRANDNDPANKVEMLNEYWACESIPSDSFCHPIECAPQENPFQIHYTRTLPVPPNDSPLLYDLGKTHIATQGMPDDGKPVGDLWVTYEVELIKPQIASSVLSENQTGFARSANAPTTVSPFGTAAVTATGSLPFTIKEKLLTFPIGTLGSFIVTVRVDAATTFTAFDGNLSATLVNCIPIPVVSDGGTYSRNVVVAATSMNSGFYQFGVRLEDPSAIATATLPAMSWSGVAAATQVTVSEL